MKQESITAPPAKKDTSVIYIAMAAMTLIATIGALNGGTALAAGVWDSLVTVIKNLLSSTFILGLSFIVLLIVVWQLSHGRGYGQAGLILGIFAVALIGPGFVTTMSTTVRPDIEPISAATDIHAPFIKTAAASN